MADELEILRKNIDSIDDSIVKLLAERLRVVMEVGKYKKQRGIVPLVAARWEQVLTTKTAKAKSLGINPELVKKIYNLIHEEALKIEKNIKL